ncbi:MAG: hypothetical protein IT361_15085 [Gemmatimonadaceae bacterium]|nr:hypothetical protein [Gemmatimonadaceae bacterium]
MIEPFRDVLVEMNAAGARFLVVGAHALAAHGVPRVTGDLDLWVERSPDNAMRVWLALVAFGAPFESLGVQAQDFEAPDRVVQLGLPPYRIDVLTDIFAVAFEDAWPQRVPGVMFGVSVAFLGRADLLRNKRASARPRDIEDVRRRGGQ